jgi:hypothetical protein
MLAAAVMQQAWHQGERRVRLFCADELRPAACCIVDALHARGYEVSLLTGPEARIGLQQPASAEILRVIWAPEGTDKQSRSRLRDALDPDSAGDVMVLASSTPRGVIDAIDAFGTPPRRSRIKGPLGRRTFLANPTLMELDRGAKGWLPGVAAASVVAVFVIGGLSFLGGRPPRERASAPTVTASESMSSPKRDEAVLASGRAAVDLDLEEDEEEPIILDDAPVRASGKRAAEAVIVEELEAAPIERTAPPTITTPVPTSVGGGMPMGGMPTAAPSRRPFAIDPF